MLSLTSSYDLIDFVHAYGYLNRKGSELIFVVPTADCVEHTAQRAIKHVSQQVACPMCLPYVANLTELTVDFRVVLFMLDECSFMLLEKCQYEAVRVGN